MNLFHIQYFFNTVCGEKTNTLTFFLRSLSQAPHENTLTDEYSQSPSREILLILCIIFTVSSPAQITHWCNIMFAGIGEMCMHLIFFPVPGVLKISQAHCVNSLRRFRRMMFWVEPTPWDLRLNFIGGGEACRRMFELSLHSLCIRIKFTSPNLLIISVLKFIGVQAGVCLTAVIRGRWEKEGVK